MPVSLSGVMFGVAIWPNGVFRIRPPANGVPPTDMWQGAQSEAIAM